MPALAKGEGLDQRLLTLMSVFYSAWAGIRFHDPAVEAWQGRWMPSPLRGARKGATTQDIPFPLAIAIEHAQQQGQEVAGLLLDRLKCFGRLCRDITFGLQRRAGCPERLVAARVKLYAHLKRYIKIGRCYGEPFIAKNGASQGCA